MAEEGIDEDTQGGETEVVEITSTTDPTPVNPPGFNNGSTNLVVDSGFAAAAYSGQKAQNDPNWFLWNSDGTDKYISKPGNPGEAATLGNYLAEEVSASGELFYGISLPIKVIPGTLYTLSAFIGSGKCGPDAGIALVVPNGTNQGGTPNIISGTQTKQAAATHSTISATWTCPSDGSIDEVAFLLSSFSNNIGTGGYQYMAKPMFQVGTLSAYVDGPASPAGTTVTSNLTVAPASAQADTVAASPTITSGSGAPTTAQPTASQYLRTDATDASDAVYVNTNGTASGWVSLDGSAVASTLEGLTDIDHTTETAGYVLSKTASNGKPFSFIAPPTSGGGGGGATTLESLTDVSVAGKLPGQVLEWNGTDWVAVTPTSGGSGGSTPGIVIVSGIMDETGNDLILDETGAAIEQEQYPPFPVIGTLYFRISAGKFSVYLGTTLGWYDQP